jgi:hypothetical protein
VWRVSKRTDHFQRKNLLPFLLSFPRTNAVLWIYVCVFELLYQSAYIHENWCERFASGRNPNALLSRFLHAGITWRTRSLLRVEKNWMTFSRYAEWCTVVDLEKCNFYIGEVLYNKVNVRPPYKFFFFNFRFDYRIYSLVITREICHADSHERALKMEVARSDEILSVRSEKTVVWTGYVMKP